MALESAPDARFNVGLFDGEAKPSDTLRARSSRSARWLTRAGAPRSRRARTASRFSGIRAWRWPSPIRTIHRRRRVRRPRLGPTSSGGRRLERRGAKKWSRDATRPEVASFREQSRRSVPLTGRMQQASGCRGRPRAGYLPAALPHEGGRLPTARHSARSQLRQRYCRHDTARCRARSSHFTQEVS